MVSVGLHLTGLQGLYSPRFKTEVSDRHQWFNRWWELTYLKQGLSDTSPCEADGRQDRVAIIAPRGRGEAGSYRGN